MYNNYGYQQDHAGGGGYTHQQYDPRLFSYGLSVVSLSQWQQQFPGMFPYQEQPKHHQQHYQYQQNNGRQHQRQQQNHQHHNHQKKQKNHQQHSGNGDIEKAPLKDIRRGWNAWDPSDSNRTSYSSDQKDEDQDQQDVKPFFYCRWVTSWPAKFFAVLLVAQIVFQVLLGTMILSGVDVIDFVFDRVPLEIQDDVDYLRGLAWDERDVDTDVIKRVKPADSSGERSEIMDTMTSYFYIKNGNVFTKENLILMKQVEEDLFTFDKYQEGFCRLDTNGNCEIPVSLVRYFDGTYAHIHEVFNDPDFDNVDQVLYMANHLNETKRGFQQFLGKNSHISETEVRSDITRMSMYIGYPLKGYDSIADREEDQENDVKQFCLDHWNPVAEKFYKDKVGGMQYYYNSYQMLMAVLIRQVVYDQALAGGSLLFIFLFMWLQTQSLWITSFSIMSIMSSFVISTLIYRYIFDFRYFGVFHVLAIFIVLGIGADNTFVFYDTWKATAFKKYPSVAHRMSDAYKKAAAAMFFTSATTAAAFAVSASSPFLSVSSFGVFSGILIVVNYLSVIIMFPTTVMTYHNWWDKYKCFCCKLKGPETAQDKKRWIVRFFAGPYYKIISHKVIRWLILAAMTGFVAFCAYYASKIEVQEEQMKFLKDSTNFGKYQTLTNNAFKTNEINVQVLVTWGLKEQDLSRCHRSDVYCMGDTVWDEDFNMNSIQAQQDLIDFCNHIRGLPADKIEKLALKTDIVTGLPEVRCFTDEMVEFYNNEASRNNSDGTDRFTQGEQFNVPINKEQSRSLIQGVPSVYDESKFGDLDRYFEPAINYWLMDGFDLKSELLVSDYDTRLGFTKNTPDTGEAELNLPLEGGAELPVIFTYGLKMRYMSIIANLTLSPNSLGYPTATPIRDEWEEYVSGRVALMSEPMRGGVMCTPLELTGDNNSWLWLKTQRNLVRSAVMGIGIGIAIAFPILVVATQNILIGTYATVTIVFVTTSVVGFVPLLGWKLGVMESINLVLVVGLAVDYVVHLAEGYRRSRYTTRLDRTRDMLEEVGVSVLSGAITTIGASALLLIAQIVFFVQFGLFIFLTITFSIVYALIMFTTFMALAGPEGNTGSLTPLFNKIKQCCRSSRRKEQHKQNPSADYAHYR